jgi:cyclic pyranopterin phosphate synthase
MPREHYAFTPAPHLMQPEEIRVIAKTFTAMGVTKIRLTGGEPLARKDADVILRQLSSLPVTLALTTNGTLLDRYLPLLKEANVQSLNISLDTLSREKFRRLTKRDMFDRVRGNIQLALESGFRVKINMVVMKGWNEAEIPDFIDWARDEPVQVRFIEFMPFRGNRWTGNQVFSLKEILEVISSRDTIEYMPGDPHATGREYRIAGHRGSFAVISTMSAPFCSGCNRMRLTADGKMKNCLFSRDETDILSALRKGEPIEPLIWQNVLEKAEALGGQMAGDFNKLQSEHIENRSMISIGG